MKRFSIFSLMLVLAFQASAGVIKVACVGDSITYGARVQHRERLCYPMQLQKMLGDKYQVVNFGVNGRTLLRKGNLPYWETGQYKQALKWKPNVVIIKLGTNDTKMVNWKFSAEFEKDLTDLADSFLNLSSKPKVFLSLPVPAFMDGDSIDRKRVRDGVIPIVKKVAAAKNLPVIDFYTRMQDKSALMPDHVHPNARGAFELASEVYKTLVGKAYYTNFRTLKSELMKGLAPATARWRGFKYHEFKRNGAVCRIVEPKKVAAGTPWIWRARFWGHEPQTDVALLNQGFHVAYCDVRDLFGSPKAIARWNDFYDYVTGELGFSKKVSLEGMSRGGLIIFNWTKENLDKVNCIYGDAPVCDFKSWPGAKGQSKGDMGSWKRCLQAYGFKNELEALRWRTNPLDNAAAIAKAKIPVLIVYGKADKVVPDFENCLVFEKNFKAAGGDDITLIGKANCGHHPHSLKNPKPIVDFVLKHSKLKKKLSKIDFKNAIKPRRGLSRAFAAIKSGKARVAFLGGSITEMKGWRNRVAASLRKRFPDTKFDFVFGGIGSTDSTMGAFRIDQDIFKNGKVDLLFIESAVNELANGRKKAEVERAVEGIIRHAFTHNPNIDIVAQYFSDKDYLKLYRLGKTPWQTTTLNNISKHYHIASINQAILLEKEIRAGKITEKEFSHDRCHPIEKGHKLYARHINDLFDLALKSGSVEAMTLPAPLYADNFASGTYLDIKKAKLGDGWHYVKDWKPVRGSTRKQFVHLPVLETTKAGAELTLDFEGSAIGITIPAGYDVGILEYSVDGAPFKQQDLFTQWSHYLHIPWIHVLEPSLAKGPHKLTLRMSDKKNKRSKGTACRICYFAINP